MGEILREGLCELQELRQRDWPISRATVTAESDYSSVLLPADFGVALRNGFFVAGNPIVVISVEEYLERRRPNADGGGITLCDVTGDPAYGVIQVAAQADSADGGSSADDEAWRQALWLFPAQSAAWSLEVNYRATAKNLSADADTIRLPTRLHAVLFLYIAASWREKTGRPDDAERYWALYDKRLARVENVPLSEDIDLHLSQGFPLPS